MNTTGNSNRDIPEQISKSIKEADEYIEWKI